MAKTDETFSGARMGHNRAEVLLSLAAVMLAIVGLILVGQYAFRFARPGTTRASAKNALLLTTETMAFGKTELTAVAGEITVQVDNASDLPHTFTIDELGVDLAVAARSRGVAAFTAGPGTYHFYCGVAGHEAAGMTGTLAVAAP
jgi:plastocyanin